MKKIILHYSIALVFITSFLFMTKAQKPGTKKWSYTTDNWPNSSPAISMDGTIYVGTNGKSLYAFTPEGNQKWKFKAYGVIISSPAISVDGTIYVGSYDNNIYAINPDGSMKWSYKTGFDIYSSPAIDENGNIYIGSKNGYLHAINTNGVKKWDFNSGSEISSSPSISMDGTIYVGSGNKKLYAIHRDGTKQWEFLTDGHIKSSPAIGADGTIYVGSRDNKLYAIKPDGTKKWEFTTGGDVDSSPAIGTDGTIYVGSNDDKVYAINPDGTKKWEFKTGLDVNSSPAIGSDGTIYIGSDDGNLYALSPDGIRLWKYYTGNEITSSPAISTDGIIYFGAWNDRFYAIYSQSEGLLDGPWPKFRNNGHNTGMPKSSLFIPENFECHFQSVHDYVETSLELHNSSNEELSTLGLEFKNDNFYSVQTFPLTIPSNDFISVPIRVLANETDLVTSEYTIKYNMNGAKNIHNGEIKIVVFIEDSNETLITAHKAYDAYMVAKGMNNIAKNNNQGVIYRLVEEYELAELYFDNAVSEALNMKYGFSGIKMNQGIIKSDKKLSADAMELYESVYVDIETDESTSVLAPQMYYNKAWEEYSNENFGSAYNKALNTINHNKTNDFLKAKAYALLGAIQTKNDSYSDARTNFREAMLLDETNIISDIAEENLVEISRPRVMEELKNIRANFNDKITIQLNLFGEGPFEFEWFKNNKKISTSNTNEFSISSFLESDIGEYFCIVANWAGKDTSNVFQITEQGIPEISVSGSTEFCTGNSVELTGPDGYTAYLWSNGKTTQSIIVTRSGDFSLQVINEYGFKSPPSQEVTIKVNPLPDKPTIKTSGPTSICSGDEVKLSGPAGFNYEWLNGDKSQTIQVKESGTHSLQVIDAKGCKSQPSSDVTIGVFPLPQKPIILSSGTTQFCEGESIELSGPEGFSYIWSNNENTQTIKLTESGSISLQVIDQHNCMSELSQQVEVQAYPIPEKPTVLLSGDSIICEDTGLELSAPEGYTYLWSNGAKTQKITVNETGSYSVKITNTFHCSTISNEIPITVLPSPEKPKLDFEGTVHLCEGEIFELVAPVDNMGVLWSTGAKTPNLQISSEGEYSLQLIGENNCISPASKLVKVAMVPQQKAPLLQPEGNISVCEGDEVILEAPEAVAYEWSNGDTTQSIIVTETNIYSVFTIDKYNCKSQLSNSVNVSFNSPEKAQITYQNGILLSSVQDNIQWLYGNEIIDGAIDYQFQPEKVGYYHVEVSGKSGCISLSEPFFWTENSSIQSNNEIPNVFKIFPNPTNEQVQISIDYHEPIQSISLKIFNSVGQKVWTGKYFIPEIHFSKKISLTQFTSGIYYLYVISDDIYHCEKFVIQK